MDEPSIWTTLVIENGEDEAARLHVFIHLSQNSLLDVVFRASIITSLALIAANASKIRSFRLNESPSELANAIFDIGYALPTLQVLYADYRVIPSNFLRLCPNLTTISGFVNIGDHHSLNPAARDVNFTGVTSNNIDGIAPHMKYRSLGINIDPNFIYNFVDYIDPKRWPGNLETLSTHLGARLQSLSMTISSRSLIPLILHVPLLHRLHTLSLTIFLSYQEEPDEVIIPEGSQQVRSVHLQFLSTEEAQDSKALDVILETFDKARFLQKSEEISISSSVGYSVSQLGSCLQSAINARIITVNAGWYHEILEQPIPKSSPMTKLEFLTVDCLPLLEYINTAHPISLKLVSTHRPPRKRKFAFQVARYDDFGTLDLLDPVDQEELLHNFRTIVFMGHFKLHLTLRFSELADVDLSGDWIEMGDFLNGISRDPEVCPYLHTIRINTYPF